MILSRNILKRVGESRHPCRTLNYGSEPVSYVAVEEDGPQSCIPKPVEGPLEVYEDTVEVLLVLETISNHM